MALTATDLFNDATTREIGGVGPDQVNLIVSDLIGVQQMLSRSSSADQQSQRSAYAEHHPAAQRRDRVRRERQRADYGTLTLGTDLGQFVGRSINDIHRDIIDIAQGDAGVQAIFNPTPLPALNTPAAPFHDSATRPRSSRSGSRTATISGRPRPRSRTMASPATSQDWCSRSRPTPPTRTRSIRRKAGCGRRASGTNSEAMAPRAWRRMR